MKQSKEKQCQYCDFWLTKSKGSTTCFPRAFSFILANVNETAKGGHDQTFKDCIYRDVKQGVK